MKIEIKYPKLTNLYSFISNLSQWNELVCVPRRKKEWVKKTGKLSQRERMALKEFSQIFQKAKINLEPIFLFESHKKVWPILSKEISQESCHKIRSIFRIFESRFDKIWKDEKKKLKRIAKEFINKKFQISRNLEDIEKLCGLSKEQLPQKMEVRLLLSSKGDCQGWSFKEVVVLECSGWPIKKINYLFLIFLHECFHILFKRNGKLFSVFKSVINRNRQIINKTELKNWMPEVIFEEALISSFLPEGYLSEKILKINSRKVARKELAKKRVDKFAALRNFCALHLYDSAKKFVSENKPLDEFYFEKTVKCIRDFVAF